MSRGLVEALAGNMSRGLVKALAGNMSRGLVEASTGKMSRALIEASSGNMSRKGGLRTGHLMPITRFKIKVKVDYAPLIHPTFIYSLFPVFLFVNVRKGVKFADAYHVAVYR